MISYLAYGSNLHPLRLMERVPSARLVGVTALSRYRLMFHKRGMDQSSKCNVIRTGTEADLVYGAIYEMDPAHKPLLDRVEGKGHGYLDMLMTVQYQGQAYRCFTYLAQESYLVDNHPPYHWYKQLVVLGARYLQFPDTYIGSIESVESMDDPDKTRRTRHNMLIENILNYPARVLP